MSTIVKFNLYGSVAFFLTVFFVKMFGTGENVATIATASGNIILWMFILAGNILDHLKK